MTIYVFLGNTNTFTDTSFVEDVISKILILPRCTTAVTMNGDECDAQYGLSNEESSAFQ